MPLLSGSVLFAAVALQSPSAVHCPGPDRRVPALRSRMARGRPATFDGLPGGVDLYSLRARRRLASLLRLRLLELRKADLERVSRTLELRLRSPAQAGPLWQPGPL